MSKFVAASSNVYRLTDVDSHVSVSFFSFTGGRFPIQIITFVMCYLFFVPDTHSLVDLDPRSFRSNVLFSLTTLHFIKVKPKKTRLTTFRSSSFYQGLPGWFYQIFTKLPSNIHINHN